MDACMLGLSCGSFLRGSISMVTVYNRKEYGVRVRYVFRVFCYIYGFFIKCV